MYDREIKIPRWNDSYLHDDDDYDVETDNHSCNRNTLIATNHLPLGQQYISGTGAVKSNRSYAEARNRISIYIAVAYSLIFGSFASSNLVHGDANLYLALSLAVLVVGVGGDILWTTHYEDLRRASIIHAVIIPILFTISAIYVGPLVRELYALFHPFG